ncbi:AraC family transcriptional regulator [Paenibacillus qinlingensis]|uniref:AraC-like DNA-binding protein/mannose-6-phosphate isomerase-like protein (Cupin superfamily) n=1 Tax=Paenibacillus qinlingensis TaxID=1837343 RepID=A0ABU1NNQ6_9BACL|nr:AraC family transcriptional regulator [Paenibacillus qinlingensis]MDR6549100.1 AraC-like DNA-binding protein/mannose-6-phosphate isomerase-like protein (cupin superfamily) [Paenibacillus qinlingensis]
MNVDLEAYDKERVDYSNPNLRLKIWEIHHPAIRSDLYGPWHYHEEVEWILILQGSMTMETTQRAYKLEAGDVVLFGSNEIHRSHKHMEQELTYLVCHVDMAAFMDQTLMPYFAAWTGRSANLTRLNSLFSKYPQCRTDISQLLNDLLEDMTTKQRGYELSVNATLKRLLYVLVKYDDEHVIVPMDPQFALKLSPALDYIEQLLEDKCQLEDVSSKLNYNSSYFAKMFKKAMGITFTEYVQLRRMKRAEQLLLTESSSITEISAKVGFVSPAQFYQLFRRHYGCSPKKYMSRRNFFVGG